MKWQLCAGMANSRRQEISSKLWNKMCLEMNLIEANEEKKNNVNREEIENWPFDSRQSKKYLRHFVMSFCTETIDMET